MDTVTEQAPQVYPDMSLLRPMAEATTRGGEKFIIKAVAMHKAFGGDQESIQYMAYCEDRAMPICYNSNGRLMESLDSDLDIISYTNPPPVVLPGLEDAITPVG